jgi:predicted dehydrogenase
MEKPLSADLESAVDLKAQIHASKSPLLLGYTWRWWPALEKIRSLVSDGRLGRPYYARFNISAHLADWHPWEDYREFFMAHEELGGGALLDESHWIDQMIWLFGMPHTVFGVTKKLSNLEISSDDLVELIAFYQKNLIVSVHLDIFGRPHEKSIQVYGDNGSISWSEEKKLVRIVDASANVMVEEFNHDRNFMFERVAAEFLSVIQDNSRPSCTIEDGVKVLEIVEAIRRSQLLGQSTRVNEEKDVS